MNHIFYVTFQRPACFLILIWIVFDGFSFAQRWLTCTIAFTSLSEVGLVIERNDWLIQPVYQNAWDEKDRENKIPAGNSIFAYKDMRRWAILTGEVENELIKVSLSRQIRPRGESARTVNRAQAQKVRHWRRVSSLFTREEKTIAFDSIERLRWQLPISYDCVGILSAGKLIWSSWSSQWRLMKYWN